MFRYLIIGIHGLSNKPPASRLKAWWTEAIVEGLRRNLERSGGIAFDLAYWADLMYDAPLDPDPEPYAPAAGTGPLPRRQDSSRRRIKDQSKAAAVGLADKTTAVPGLGRIVDEVIERKAPDLHAYYHDPDQRLRIQQKLSDALAAAHQAGQHILLIAHSMGSIVAFDVLSTIESTLPGFRVHHLITVGSPLGFHQVKKKIRAEDVPLRVPETVEAWTNLADRKDKVASDTRLRTDYKSNRRGVGVVDRLVINGYVAPPPPGHEGKPNPHKIYGYLRTPELSEAIDRFITA